MSTDAHASKLIGRLRYRPEIDGLRAVAVIAVVLFHAEFGCSGGYVGVDVFFVISGFLITSLIWKDLETGAFTFAHFWERRARRIVPALVAVTMAVLIAGSLLLLPDDFRNLGGAAAAQAVFAANVFYWRDSGYFGGAAEFKPLLHTWSLAVEEQFYLIVPFLMFGLFCSPRLRTRTAVLSILGSIFFASLAVSVYGTRHFTSAAFYLLQSRAWELLTGAIIAFLPKSFSIKSRALREALAAIGLSAIVYSISTYSDQTPFPGWAALAPCLGTALLIWTNDRLDEQLGLPTAIGAVLATRPVVFIGLISYSLYLWHWPVLAMSRYVALAPLTVTQRSGLVCLGFALAVVSWRFVETPFRLRRWGASRQSVFAFAAAGLGIVFVVAALTVLWHGFPGRFPRQAREFASARDDMAFLRGLTIADVRAGRLISVGEHDPRLHPAVLVWGDSHAMAALPAIDALLKERGMSGRAAMHSSTAPVLDWFIRENTGLNEEAIAFNDAVFDYAERYRIRIVILTAYWSGYTKRSRGAASRSFDAALLRTVRRLVAIGSRPVVLFDVPSHSFDVPRALARAAASRADISSFNARPSPQSEFDGVDRATVAAIAAAGGLVLDPKPRFLDARRQYYIVESQGVALYRDQQHLTTRGAHVMLLPLFRDALPLSEDERQRAQKARQSFGMREGLY